MSQLGKIAWLSQPYSTWPSMLLGSGSRVIFIYSPLLDALTMYPRLSLLCPLSSCLSSLPSVCLVFVCISPSISVPVPVLAMCSLTDGPLFAVLSYLSGGGVVCLEWLLPSSLWPSRGRFSCRSRPGPKTTTRLNWKHLGDAKRPFMILR